MNAQDLASRIIASGYRLTDAANLNPTDIVEGVLALRRSGQRRVLVLERMTAKEAAFRLAEAYNDGWNVARWLRVGPPKPVSHGLRLRQA